MLDWMTKSLLHGHATFVGMTLLLALLSATPEYLGWRIWGHPMPGVMLIQLAIAGVFGLLAVLIHWATEENSFRFAGYLCVGLTLVSFVAAGLVIS